MANCFYHEEREAVARCSACGRGVCEECAIQAEGSTFCSEECKNKAAGSGARAEEVLARKAKTDSSTLVRKLIYCFVVILAIAAAYFFYAQNRKTIDAKVDRSVRQIKQETSGAVKSAQSAVPASSKAKRQRENLVK